METDYNIIYPDLEALSWRVHRKPSLAETGVACGLVIGAKDDFVSGLSTRFS